MNHLETLTRYQDWRIGRDERTMDEAGLKPKEITAAINWAIVKCSISSRWDDLEYLVEQWAADKGIFANATQMAQAHKTIEEALELAEAVRVGDHAATLDALGDVLVTVIIGCRMAGVSPELALATAYEEIKGRTGKMEGGQFVKDA